MSRTPLVFRSLGVRRMPGISDGGWELPELSPGVNVVWGPNGAGKTTTATALQRLLWPSAFQDGRPHLHARLSGDDADWRMELDGAAARWQRNGEDASPISGIPSAAERDRYRLSLHELLSETDESLAERIIHESAGGFDVGRAADKLGFRAKPSRPTSERQALENANGRVSRARDEEASLRDDEARLAVLRRDTAEHQRKARDKDLWERALERLDALNGEQVAREALDAFPADIARVSGGESVQLRDLRQALAQAENRARDAARDIEAARRELDAARLPADGLPGEVVPSLAAALHTLNQLEQTRSRLALELESARQAYRAECAAVACAVGEDRLAGLTPPAAEEMLAFAREAENHRAELRAADAEVASLSAAGPTADIEKLSRGRYALCEWLRLPADDAGRGRAHTAALVAGILAALAGAALGALVHVAAYLVVVVAIALITFALSGPRAAAGGRAARQQDYERLALDGPTAWEPAAVVALIERLEGMIGEAQVQKSRAERRAAVERTAADLRAAGARIDQRRAELAGRIGLAPDTDEAMVAWFCQRVHRWQSARVEVQRKDAELRAATAQYAKAFEAMERSIRPYATVSSPAELSGALDDLRGRHDRHNTACAKLQAAEQRKRDAEVDAAARRAECIALLARAGLAEDGDAQLEELCARRPLYVIARDRHVGAQQDAHTADRRLAETAGFTESVLAPSRAQVESALAESREAAAHAQATADEVARLDERLRAARTRTDVEDALAAVQDAESTLRDCRDRDGASVIGWALKEHVERETRDRDRPAVFHRARGLFAAITRGRYELHLSADSPAFRAVDTSTGAGCGLDELSRGTRVQLLLAVRIAFIETMESGPMLPLVLDEALGNSDDQRAEAVMDAVMELARAGRQIFFLTARLDEADRWMERLRAADVPHALVDLGAARRMARYAELPRPAATTVRLGAVPAPGDMDHAAYGAALQVPAIDADRDVGAIHLWYLVDDPALLHRLLTLGAGTWGSLRTLVKEVGTALLGPDESAFVRLEALARAMECLLDARRIGRGRPVDRDALDRSGAITPAFSERVETVRRDCGGRPDALLAGIAALSRFRGENVATLRDFLEREGYLDSRDPLDDATIRARLLAAMATDLRAGTLAASDLDRLMDLVAAWAALTPRAAAAMPA